MQQQKALSHNGRLALRELKNGEWLNYASHSEKACVVLLEKCVPGWVARNNRTFQIEVDDKHKIDFKISGVFVEYHPISLPWCFKSKDAHAQIANALDNIDPQVSLVIARSLELEFKAQYYATRRAILDQHFKDSELIVVSSPRDFVNNVLLRFGEGFEVPLVNAFEKIRMSSYEAHKRSDQPLRLFVDEHNTMRSVS